MTDMLTLANQRAMQRLSKAIGETRAGRQPLQAGAAEERDQRRTRCGPTSEAREMRRRQGHLAEEEGRQTPLPVRVMSTVPAYPLQWPDHIPRSKSREKSKFKTTLPGALKNVRHSIEAFGRDSGKTVSSIVLSSNITLGNDRPADPGVAAWFTWDGMSLCIPVDRYLTAEENLQAIHHVLEARRTELRHGTLHLVKATFKGFAALPPPPGAKPRRPWWDVMGFTGPDVARHNIEDQYRALAKIRHPDAGGSAEQMAELNAARKEALG